MADPTEPDEIFDFCYPVTIRRPEKNIWPEYSAEFPKINDPLLTTLTGINTTLETNVYLEL